MDAFPTFSLHHRTCTVQALLLSASVILCRHPQPEYLQSRMAIALLGTSDVIYIQYTPNKYNHDASDSHTMNSFLCVKCAQIHALDFMYILSSFCVLPFEYLFFILLPSLVQEYPLLCRMLIFVVHESYPNQ
eukprot:169174_1